VGVVVEARKLATVTPDINTRLATGAAMVIALAADIEAVVK
jgi:hypothetical protein